MRRKVEVVGNAPGGFDSAIVLMVDRSVSWTAVNYMAPGALYGDPAHNGERSPGGTLNYAARHYQMREDFLPAPLFALSFQNGASVAVLDPSPRGDSTFEETKLTKDVMTDARFQFGALGAWQDTDGPIEFGFWFPGSVTGTYMGGPPDAKPRTVRRYHPITHGVAHSYEVRFRFGANESFRDVTRDNWRWAWNTLHPAVTYIDVDQMRRVLIDHLAAQAATIDGRTAIPFVLSTVTDKLQWNWTMVAMGFVGKELECADQLLREGDRDSTERGQEDAPDWPGHYLVDDPSPSDCAASRHRLRSCNRQALGSHLARSVVAERDRRHARADARLSTRACARTRASRMVRLGEVLCRLVDFAAAR